MSREADNTPEAVSSSAQTIVASLIDKHVCPFCGTINDNPDAKCPRCTLEDTPAIRQATKMRIGPWYVLQSRNPAAPGMRFSVLLSLVQKGQITARSVIRGPTTHQLWRFAARVKGLGREFGICYGCNGDIQRNDHLCPHCQRMQDPPGNPDLLLEVWTSRGEQNSSSTSATHPTGDVSPASRIVRAVPSPTVEQTARPRGFIPPPADRQMPSPTPELASSVPVPISMINPRELAETLSIRMEPRWPRRISRSIGLFLLMTLVGVATWLLIDSNSQKIIFNWFSQSFDSIRSSYREPTTQPSPRKSVGTDPTIPKGWK